MSKGACVCHTHGYSEKTIKEHGHEWTCPDATHEKKDALILSLTEARARDRHTRSLILNNLRAHQGKLAVIRHENNKLRKAMYGKPATELSKCQIILQTLATLPKNKSMEYAIDAATDIKRIIPQTKETKETLHKLYISMGIEHDLETIQDSTVYKQHPKNLDKYIVLYWKTNPKLETEEFRCRATDSDDAHEQWSRYMKGTVGYHEYEICKINIGGKRSQAE